MKNNWKRWLIFPALLPFFSWMEAKTLEENQIQQSLDTIEYRVFVAVDKAGVEHWGGKEAYQAKLNAFFDQVNDFWNKAGNGRFQLLFPLYTGSAGDLRLLLPPIGENLSEECRFSQSRCTADYRFYS